MPETMYEKMLLKLTTALSWVVALVMAALIASLLLLYFPPKPSPKCSSVAAATPGYFATARFHLDSLKDDVEGRSIRYGHALISETYHYMGPEVKTKAMRYTGNHLACQNCHLQAGQKAFAAPFVGIWGIYPMYKGREDEVSSLEERINGCMERSMNGKALPLDSKEMEAMVLYIRWLSRETPAGHKIEGQGFINLVLPDRAADLVKGKAVFVQKCASCHGPEGQGQPKAAAGKDSGYIYPPLWGPDSFNDGAGMHRLITAARFIKANMPLGATAGQPLLTDAEAYDVAAYINSRPRPVMAHKEKDYPNLSKKPMDCPYPPYKDDFPVSQHQYGPFQPIAAAYQRQQKQ